MDVRLDAVEERLSAVEVRLDSVENRLGIIEECYLGTYTRYVQEAAKIQTMEDDIKTLKNIAAEHEKKLA